MNGLVSPTRLIFFHHTVTQFMNLNFKCIHVVDQRHNNIQQCVYIGWGWEEAVFYSELYSVYSHNKALR